jgi:DUF1680 family protein
MAGKLIHHTCSSLHTNTLQIDPSPEYKDIQKGYLYLSVGWLHQHPKFRLSYLMIPQVVRPHPLAMQPVAYITRGPIVYCVEDFDHPWEKHHFKVRQETHPTE